MRVIVIPALVLSAAAAAAWAQDNKAGAVPASAKIAVIDMQRVSAESILGKSYAQQLEALKNEIDAEGTKKQNELNKLDGAIKTLQDELDKQGGVLSPEAAQKKADEIKKKQRDRQAYLEDGQAELERMRERARQQAQGYNNEFQAKVKPLIEAVAKEKGVDILLDSQVAITVSKVFDISQDVIIRSDDAERAGKKPAAPPAASAPKPSPTPKP
jgi:Skp family chaperone for outer membrane proteins